MAAPLLEVRDLDVTDDDGLPRVAGVSFSVAAGEVVGIAGVTGSGQSELVEALIALRAVAGGQITLAGHVLDDHGVRARRDRGIAYVPEDRHAVGSAGPASTSDNLLMGYQWRRRFQRGGWLKRRPVRRHAADLVEQFDIKVSGIDQPVGQLSGGNLQKVVVAREFGHDAPLLIVEQPTRGVRRPPARTRPWLTRR